MALCEFHNKIWLVALMKGASLALTDIRQTIIVLLSQTFHSAVMLATLSLGILTTVPIPVLKTPHS